MLPYRTVSQLSTTLVKALGLDSQNASNYYPLQAPKGTTRLHALWQYTSNTHKMQEWGKNTIESFTGALHKVRSTHCILINLYKKKNYIFIFFPQYGWLAKHLKTVPCVYKWRMEVTGFLALISFKALSTLRRHDLKGLRGVLYNLCRYPRYYYTSGWTQNVACRSQNEWWPQ